MTWHQLNGQSGEVHSEHRSGEERAWLLVWDFPVTQPSLRFTENARKGGLPPLLMSEENGKTALS